MEWQTIRNIFLQFLEDYLKEKEKEFSDFVEKFIEQLKRKGFIIDFELEEKIKEFADKQIQDFQDFLLYTSAAVVGRDMRDSLVQKIIADVFETVYPDGLTLSERLWNWNKDMRHNLKEVVKHALVKGRSMQSIVYEIQEELNKSGSIISIKEKMPKWAQILKNAALTQDRQQYKDTLKKFEYYIDNLSKNGTYYGSKQFIKELEKFLEEKKIENIEKATYNFIYQKQLYRLKTIARTESANVYHKAQIVMTENDPHLIGYRWRLSRSHPKPDICDYYANIDYGLGKGVFPKDKVPRSKAHPHCMCYLEPVYKFEVKRKEVKSTPEVPEDVLMKFAPKTIRKLVEEKGYDIKQFFDPKQGKFIIPDFANL